MEIVRAEVMARLDAGALSRWWKWRRNWGSEGEVERWEVKEERVWGGRE